MVSLSQCTSQRSRPVAVTPTSSHSTAWFRLMKFDTLADDPSAARVLASSTAQDTQKQAVNVCLQPEGTSLIQGSMEYDGYNAPGCCGCLVACHSMDHPHPDGMLNVELCSKPKPGRARRNACFSRSISGTSLTVRPHPDRHR